MLNDPHDRLFKAIFARPALVADLLLDLLPEHLTRQVDFRTLARRSESAVDHRLGTRFSDLLFIAQQRGAAGRILFLFEHRSSPAPHLPLRVYRYAGDALEDHRKRHPRDKRYPGVFVVVVHHGKRAWTGPRSLQQACALTSELVAAARHEMPDCPFRLDDLAAQSEQHLLRRPLVAAVKLVLWLLKHAHQGRGLVERLPTVADLLVGALESQGVELASTISRYIIEVGQTSIEEILDIVETELDSQLEKPFMNAAEQLRREGWKKGRQEGLEQGLEQGREQGREQGLRQGRQVTLLKLLAVRFGPVPERFRRRVRRAGDDKLDLWTERVLAARTLDEVFE